MRIARVVLVLGLLAAPLAGEAQTPGKVYRVGLIAATTPVARIMSDPTHPLSC